MRLNGGEQEPEEKTLNAVFKTIETFQGLEIGYETNMRILFPQRQL